MIWTVHHSEVLAQAFTKVLGRPGPGNIAFVRCLPPEVVEQLAKDERFNTTGWNIYRVAEQSSIPNRTITADHAVELRESKQDSILFLVDTSRAGAGMDGIYSAAREIDELELFKEGLRTAARKITNQQTKLAREFAEKAVKKAKSGRLYSVSPWQELDYYLRVVDKGCHPGELLWLIGLWPVSPDHRNPYDTEALNVARLFVDRLLGTVGQNPPQRIEAMRLAKLSEEQSIDLHKFLYDAGKLPLLLSLENLADQKHLWINEVKLEAATQNIQQIELIPWRTIHGKLAKWSGLIEGTEDNPPVLTLDPQADANGNYSKLEIRWKTRPDNLPKDSVQYQVRIVTDMEEELVSSDVSHTGKKEEKCRFTNDDFSFLDDDTLINVRIIVSVIGADKIEPQSSEEFVIKFGAPPEKEVKGLGGKVVRTFSEGLIELDDHETVTAIAADVNAVEDDSKGYKVIRTAQRNKNFKVFCPPLLREIEHDWFARKGEIGRWKVKVRTSGVRAGKPEFIPISARNPNGDSEWPIWDRAVSASRQLAERFATSGGCVGQIYDQHSKIFDRIVKGYMLAWSSLLEEADPQVALANTVEIQSLSGNTIGLIVLPSHPLRVAWHVAYDNLVLHARFNNKLNPKQIREEFKLLDGAVFPAFLPGLEKNRSFVFADTLGFHVVGMVQDDDKEPKAAIAILTRALGESETADTSPTVGRQSAEILGNEICKYIECHQVPQLMHIHALHPGDGQTVARALGYVRRKLQAIDDPEESASDNQQSTPSFVLELYPSKEQRGLAGRFIGETREKRRSGAGVLLEQDQWMLESINVQGGIALPRLRWARKSAISTTIPSQMNAAHLAIAFDTFESHVVAYCANQLTKERPYFAFGLMSFFEREYTSLPVPIWMSLILRPMSGEKHPADRAHTDRLQRLNEAVLYTLSRHLEFLEGMPALRTEINPEKSQSLSELHKRCDWVITLDRNAGIEYFDSPRDNRDIYDAYVIDCVPEREDLGCLQLITSTSNLDEIRNLLDGALDLMGLSRSRKNAEYLREHLKALSGRLAIRLTGQKAPTAELIALAMCHANSFRAAEDDNCWTSLKNGFFIPVDDIKDLLPQASNQSTECNSLEDTSAVDIDYTATRPDLIYLTLIPRKGLLFRFVEVKYRRHLRTARSPEALQKVRSQVEQLRSRWEKWYSSDSDQAAFRSIRRAKLARVLRFYADKARRHADDENGNGLSEQAHADLVKEIDRMVEKGADYSFADIEIPDRGFIFCPEYSGALPLDITPDNWNTRVFMFGPDSEFCHASFSVDSKVPIVQSRAFSTQRSKNPGTAVTESKTDSIDITSKNKSSVEDNKTSSTDDLVVSSQKNNDSAEPTIYLGTNVLNGAEVGWNLSVKRNPHLLMAGLPGMGKTTCLMNICRQMQQYNINPIVFSYHQDIDEKFGQIFRKVRYVDFSGLGFNPLQVIDRDPKNKSRNSYLDVAGAVRDIFAAIFPELGDVQCDRIRKAIKESFCELGWDDQQADLKNLHEPAFKRFVEIMRCEPKPDRGLKTLLSRLEELEDYGFFESGESQETLWDSVGPVVLRIHTTQNDNLQKAFSSLVFYGLYKDMFRRGIQDRITHAIIFDEAHRAARLKLIPTMAKECRKYGISLVLASQEASDFNSSLFSAVANYLIMRLTEIDAKVLVRNVASSDQEKQLIDRIKQMERYRAFYCSEGQKKPVLVSLQQ